MALPCTCTLGAQVAAYEQALANAAMGQHHLAEQQLCDLLAQPQLAGKWKRRGLAVSISASATCQYKVLDICQ